MRIEAPYENSVSFSDDGVSGHSSVIGTDATYKTVWDGELFLLPGTFAWTSTDQCAKLSSPTAIESTPSLTMDTPGSIDKHSLLPGMPFILDKDMTQHWSINPLEIIVPGEQPGVFIITWMTMDAYYADHLRWTSCLKWSAGL